MKCSDIVKELQKLAPETLACSWDNVGLLLGRSDKNISKILIALEVNEEVVQTAVSNQVDLVITHHPMIFHPLKRINSEDFMGRKILLLLRYDIACYAMHTNFDKAAMGMGTLAADKLGLLEQRVLDEAVTYTDSEGREVQGGIGKIGHLKNGMKVKDICHLIDREFEHEGIKIFTPSHKKEMELTEVAVVPGSGGDYVDVAIESGADVLITGDVSHHQGTDAVSQDMVVIDVGHYPLEYPFVEYVERYLLERVSADVEILTVSYQAPYFITGGGENEGQLS